MKKPLNFWLWNKIAGIVVFLFSSFIYLSTLEPTVSFWDCGEFLSCASKLEICHAPGNPFFLLIGRFAAILAGSNPDRITIFINSFSAIESALTIIFLFWSITWVGRKIYARTWQESTQQKVLILCAGAIGSMAYAVSDSFWFSAVEAEVYAMSSLFTAAVFWCILMWEESDVKSSNSDRWLLFIAYLLGLSIGVHLLNLLAIPSIVLVYYFKKHKITRRNSLVAFLVGIFLLIVVLMIIIPGLPNMFSWIEIFSVNNLGFAYNSGYLIGGILLISTIGISLYYSYNKNKAWLYNSMLYFTFILIGYSTYTLIVIRAHDNPPINMTNPESPFALENYLNREQYEQRALFYGPSFNSPVVDSKPRISYERFQGKYIPFPLIPKYEYDQNTLMFFPRMSEQGPEHAEAYKQWSNFQGKMYHRDGFDEKSATIQLPTFGENLRFFFKYQLGFMYFRYFMWNFSGKQNDIQGHGNNLYGNWTTGIPFIDNSLLGPQDKLPTSLKTNPGRNTYYMLPLILGILGFWFHYKMDSRNFTVLITLFLITGIAIILYLNEIPITPRERDYVHVGSFYVFAIWIGIGVLGLSKVIEKWFKGWKNVVTIVILCACIPMMMGFQNWDDHTRKDRYVVFEYARNYLESCAPNAILLTNGDNDTYPLWYAQEVQGIRKDIRIVLAPYLGADWYIHQMREPIYGQPGLKMSLSEDKYMQGKRSYLPIVQKIDSMVELSKVLDFIGSEDDRTKVELSNGETTNYIPSRQLFLEVNKQNLMHDKALQAIPIKPEDSINITLKGSALRINQWVLLDMLASNKWERPVYFTSPQVPFDLGLEKYLQLDGYAYKLLPFKTNRKDLSEIGYIDTKTLYKKYMNDFVFKSLSNQKVYLDWTHIITIQATALREKFTMLAEALINQGENTKAIEVLDKISQILPNSKIADDYRNTRIAEAYFKAGARIKGEELLKVVLQQAKDNLTYINSLPKRYLAGVNYEMRVSLYIMQEINRIATIYDIKTVMDDASSYWKFLEGTLLTQIQQ